MSKEFLFFQESTKDSGKKICSMDSEEPSGRTATGTKGSGTWDNAMGKGFIPTQTAHLNQARGKWVFIRVFDKFH
jgi:hypothetical protein